MHSYYQTLAAIPTTRRLRDIEARFNFSFHVHMDYPTMQVQVSTRGPEGFWSAPRTRPALCPVSRLLYPKRQFTPKTGAHMDPLVFPSRSLKYSCKILYIPRHRQSFSVFTDDGRPPACKPSRRRSRPCTTFPPPTFPARAPSCQRADESSLPI